MMKTKQNTPALWKRYVPRPQPDGNKYDRGFLLVITGHLPGATRMASYAARRMGAGLVKVVAYESQKPLYSALEPGTIIEFYKDITDLLKHIRDPNISAFLFGPGVTSLNAETQEIVFQLLSDGRPCLLDAGALTAFSENKDALYENIHSKTVVTPHEGEYRRTFGWWRSRAESVARLCNQIEAVCVLKGQHTLIGQGQTLITDTQGPPSLATAGTGDVLAGFIGALLAQGMPPLEAAAMGVYCQGLCAKRVGTALIAEDLPDMLPKVLSALKL